MKTFIPKVMTGSDRKWYVVDATDVVLGKLAVLVANVLRGKNKPVYTPHLDLGDYVVVINADKVKLTGNKLEDKTYRHHTGYIGHLRSATAAEMQVKKPGKIIELAVKGMLPANKLQKDMMTRIKVFPGAEHDHAAQQPISLTI